MIILVGIGLTYLLYMAFHGLSDKIKTLQRKPFNCQFCLSFWVAMTFFITTGHYPAFLIPICYEIVRRLMNRL